MGIWFLLFIPIFYTIGGLISGLIAGVFINFGLKISGGIGIETEDK